MYSSQGTASAPDVPGDASHGKLGGGYGGLGDVPGLEPPGAHAEDRRQQPHLAEVGTARKIGEHQFAAGEDLRDLHEPHADQVEGIGDLALAADDLAGDGIHQFHALAQVLQKIGAQVAEDGYRTQVAVERADAVVPVQLILEGWRVI